MAEPNPEKNLIIRTGESRFARIPVKTRLVTEKDNLKEVLKAYLSGRLEEGDIIFLSEKMVSANQGRAVAIEKIKPTRIASFLSRCVSRRPGGIGLAMPETMQTAIEEVGLWRILLAAFFSFLTKPFGLKGVFYLIAGDGARAIDGPCDYTLPPFNRCVVKGPKNPKQTAEALSQAIAAPLAIVDVNDWGVRILGMSRNCQLSKKTLKAALKDNPLGQASESTPIGILRPISNQPYQPYQSYQSY